MINDNTENQISYQSMVNEILPGAKIIKLKGFSKGNFDYSKAKTPVGKWKENWLLTDIEINNWISQEGWIGAVVPQNRIVIDVDDLVQGKLLKQLLEGENVHHHCIKTPNGWQFVFGALEEPTKDIKQITKYFSSIGVVIDTRITGKGYIVFPTKNTEGRYVVTNSLNQLAELPHFLKPIRDSEQVVDKVTNEKYVFPIPFEEIGSRNDTLNRFAGRLNVWKVPPIEIETSMKLIYKYFVLNKEDGFDSEELMSLTNSAINWEPTRSFSIVVSDEGEEILIPLPYQIKGNALYKTIVKKVNGNEVEQEVMVSRIAPKILRELSNVERNSIHYELIWKDKDRERKEIVPASTISTKKDLLLLADSGLPCNDLNCKVLIHFFDRYLAYNPLERSFMVERLGYIKNTFIHPLAAQEVEIIPNDIGEKQLLGAFQIEGTVETWKAQVFDRIKDHKKVLFLVLSSFASVVLHDLKLSPFIIDLSGSTSQGKTTALQVARSVWGTKGLINEWNVTKVAIERKAGFLNSFPLFMDDTRKADDRILQSIVYQFSGGRSKGRGSLKGSQKEMTWNNILISTGEVSLTQYAKKAGGAAARVISLVDEPFGKVNDNYFSELYQALEESYGAVGLEFLKKWKDAKEDLLPEFITLKKHYIKKANGNEVLTRLSIYFSAVHFAGVVLTKLLNVEMDLTLLNRLYDEMTEENKGIDKPKQLLEEILYKLDSNRKYVANQGTPETVWAIYKYGTVCLTPDFLRQELGAEEKLIRKEWQKRGFTDTHINKDGKKVDYKQVKHRYSKYNTVIVNKGFYEMVGLDFEEDYDNEHFRQ